MPTSGALAVIRFIEHPHRLVHQEVRARRRRYRPIQVRRGQNTLTAEDALSPDLRDALALIK
jgi:hypothetical protein